MKNKVIPFGKYRGRDITEVAEDTQYFKWLSQQPWFSAQHNELYQLVINNFAEPDETPEHNALQARFLNNDFCIAFYACFCGLYSAADIIECMAELETDRGVDVRLVAAEGRNFEINWIGFDRENFIENLDEKSRFTWRQKLRSTVGDAGFEHKKKPRIDIEIKTILGDDYPAVLRKLKRNQISSFGKSALHNQALLIDEFKSSAITQDVLKEIFKREHIKVIFLSDVEESIYAMKEGYKEISNNLFKYKLAIRSHHAH